MRNGREPVVRLDRIWRKLARPERGHGDAGLADPDAKSPAAASDPDQGVHTAADVGFAYRLFLGRAAESPAVLEERAHQSFDDMIGGFLGSEEFDANVTRMVATSAVDGAFAAAPADDLPPWAIRLFRLPASPARRAHAARTHLDLLAVVLAHPPVRDVLARHRGAREAARLTATLAGIARGLPDGATTAATSPAAAPGTTAEEVRNLYLLLHGRAPESDMAARARPDTPFLTSVLDILTSREFSMRILSAAIDRKLDEGQPLPPTLHRWMRTAFQVALRPQASRQEAIAAILRQPRVREELARAGMLSADNVAAALDVAPSSDAGEPPASASFRALLDASGLFDAHWYREHNRDVRQSGADPLVHFLNGGVSEARDPGPDFDTAFYRDQNDDVAASGLSALDHYLRIGRPAGRAAKGPPPYQRWIERFDTLSERDHALIRADAAATPLPPVRLLHLPGADEIDGAEQARAAAAQIGIAPDVRLVARGGDHARPERALDDVADGDVVVLSARSARLRPHACYLFARTLLGDDIEAAYADHDHVTGDGMRHAPVFKPAMSPDFMARLPYAGPLIAVRVGAANRARLAATLATALERDPAEAFAAFLLGTDPRRVARVPLPLFALDRPLDDTAGPSGPAPYEPVGARTDPALPVPADPPHVSILIPTRDRVELLRDCIDSILARTDYPRDRFDIVVIDNGSSDSATLSYLGAAAGRGDCTVVASPGPFNFARICNAGAAAATGDLLLFLNNDMTVLAADWLSTLVHHARRPEIGIVGTQLLYPDGSVQHGGIILGLHGVGAHRLIGVPADEAARIDVTREMTAVTGACLAIRRAVFDQVRGFDEVLAVTFNDVALCLQVAVAGYRNLYVARPLLTHHESKSRGLDDTPAKVARGLREAVYTRGRFGRLFRDDPSYSPNLSLQEAGALAFPPRAPRPWRRASADRHVLIVAAGDGPGDDVGAVVALQGQEFRRRGWTVTIGGPVTGRDRAYPGCRWRTLATAEAAASLAVAEGVDCVIAHTPPFFSIVRYLGDEPLVYLYDHGAPPPALFADRREREEMARETRFCMPLMHGIVAVSQAVRDEQFCDDAVVLRNGSSHLERWSADWSARRAALRDRFGFGDRFVVLTVCRCAPAERARKGIEEYRDLAAEIGIATTAGAAFHFVLAIDGDADEAAPMREAGLEVWAGPSDAETLDLHAASDLYVDLSRWEGYNFGIAQALAMGLDVIASDIPAHRAFGVTTAATLPELSRLVRAAPARRHGAATDRTARVECWKASLAGMVDLVEHDLLDTLDGDRS